MSGKRWAILGVATIALVIGVFAGGRMFKDDSEEEGTFCTSAIVIGETADGRSFPTEDQGSPGPDGCDASDRPDDPEFAPGYIGYDCTLHGPDSSADTVVAPGPDGTC